MEKRKSFLARAAMMLLLTVFTTMTAWAQDVTLPSSDNYTANDGQVLTGSTDGTVTIAAGAKITLSDATINGGIVCAGTAEITLVGTNSVTGFSRFDSNIDAYRYTAGIQIGGSGTTLTINGDGSLTANGAQYAAGIGLNGPWNVTEDVIGGNIVIESGTITAKSGYNRRCRYRCWLYQRQGQQQFEKSYRWKHHHQGWNGDGCGRDG